MPEILTRYPEAAVAGTELETSAVIVLLVAAVIFGLLRAFRSRARRAP